MSSEQEPTYQRITFSHFNDFQNELMSFVGRVNSVTGTTIGLDDHNGGF